MRVDAKTKALGFSTRAIHYGYEPSEEHGALTPPLHLTSTFAFETAEAGGEMFAGTRPGHFYTRISNPTLDLLERRIAELEGAQAGLATASGMGAIAAVLWTFLSPGDELVVDNTLYGCTFALMRGGLARFGVNVRHVDMTDTAALNAAITQRTKIVYFETPTNPNMRLIDIEQVASIARTAGARTVVDSTYATPVITRPIELGADIVVHSATKYLGGHGDLIAGLAVGRTSDIEQVRLIGLKDLTGAALSPFNAMLVLRGLKTLELRISRHSESAMAVAFALERHPAVSSVLYPGLQTFPQAQLANRQMAMPGGLIAFELKGGIRAGIAAMNRLKLVRRAVSLGDAETLIQHPASMTHSSYGLEERALFGIGEGLFRLSVGLENPEDVIDDLNDALDQSAGHQFPHETAAAKTC